MTDPAFTTRWQEIIDGNRTASLDDMYWLLENYVYQSSFDSLIICQLVDICMNFMKAKTE